MGLEGIGSGGIGNQPAGQCFHGNKAHIFFFAARNNFYVFFCGKVAEGELQRFVQPAVNGLMGDFQAVVRNADVADLSLLLRFFHGFIQACAVPGLRAEGRVVELVNVDIVCFQQRQAGV